ncbi:alginate lyase family protein [Accumulibacter sp.]|uniref:heparinase II/III family protein n=1 Tax=Accumulibacter sp. TaxID=2053492 RepID=UPI0025CBA152|nr:alginate lyase family protein [Accumulibacter sp.]MCM8611630.1 heparinase II/III family protein [Accumulibacter sp.]MCM8635395.1 heparinase II/III family protein [Accumulibacter sp.]MCM8639000.1 heparinase II/III family protein [Accumulibacter sp.]
MSSLAWKINRLKLMSPAEFVWRTAKHGQKIAARFGIGTAKRPPAASLDALGRSFVCIPSATNDVGDLITVADEIIAGRWRVFAMDALPLGFPPRWNRDPKTGTVAPLAPGKSVDYRREELVGDIKYLWEPARHLELVTLALAWRVSGNPAYLGVSRTLLDSWLEQCPYPLGVHWTSSLELAVRLVNWAFAWHLLGGEHSPLFSDADGAAFRDRWLASVYQHCHFIAGYFSRHSSANNHLFGEYMGLFVASLNWPCWRKSTRWAVLAKAGLEEEAARQNFSDGVNKEQAVYYQHEVMDMMLICHVVATANGTSFSAPFMQRLERLAEFVHSLMDVNGNVPMIGDADDAEMVRLAYTPGWNRFRSLLCSCALLFGRADFKAKAGDFDAKNALLFGESGVQLWQELSAAGTDTPRREFPQGGYWVLGDQFGRPNEVRAVVDAAPLGYLSIAAHGHADALSLMLSVGGMPFLIDPGTFAYHTQKKWRDYFRGTSAHNTVRIDGQDQSVIGGNFMWLAKAKATCEQWSSDEGCDHFLGSHDGYMRLGDPVLHRRTIDFDKTARVLTVIDEVSCQAVHEVELFWHFAPGCSVSLSAKQVLASHGAQRLLMDFSGDESVADLVQGDDSAPLGWYSEAFDSKVPCVVIRQRAHVEGAAKFVSMISIIS